MRRSPLPRTFCCSAWRESESFPPAACVYAHKRPRQLLTQPWQYTNQQNPRWLGCLPFRNCLSKRSLDFAKVACARRQCCRKCCPYLIGNAGLQMPSADCTMLSVHTGVGPPASSVRLPAAASANPSALYKTFLTWDLSLPSLSSVPLHWGGAIGLLRRVLRPLGRLLCGRRRWRQQVPR